MSMHYELWDVQSGNLIEDFESEAEALSAVRELITLNGPAYSWILALGSSDGRGGGELIAEGAALAERAQTPATVAEGSDRTPSPGG